MDILPLYIITLLLFTSLKPSQGFDDEEELLLNEGRHNSPPRVDADVRRPYRACQGFEDPEEVDCYIRSDVKKYVCTEPVTFNPCESEVRVTTYHYDHIKHRCYRVNVPACPGYIIRSISLIQCLIYCHNNDPFALGKSTSIVFKLNQAKPYVGKDEELDERERAINYVNDDLDAVKNNKKSPNLKENLKDNSIQASKKENNAVKDDSKKKVAEEKKETKLANIDKNVIESDKKDKDTKDTKEAEKKELKKDSKKELAVTVDTKKDNSIKDLKPIVKKETEKVPEVKTVILNEKKNNENKDLKAVDKKEPEKVPEEKAIDKKESQKVLQEKAVDKKEPEKVPQENAIDKKQTEKVLQEAAVHKKEPENKLNDQVTKKESVKIPETKVVVANSKDENLFKGLSMNEVKGIPRLKETQFPLSNSKTEEMKSIDAFFEELKSPKNTNYKMSAVDFKTDMDKKEKELFQQLKLGVKNEKKQALFKETKPVLKEHAELIEQVMSKAIEEKETPELNPENKREIEFMDEDNNIVKKNAAHNRKDKLRKTDSKDKGTDDGFYLWDE